MKKYIICLIATFIVIFNSVTVFASESVTPSKYPNDIIEATDAMGGEIVDVLDLYPQNDSLNLRNLFEENGATLFSVPKKIVVTSTTHITDYSNVIAKSPIVGPRMTASVSYTKNLSASFNCSASVGVGLVSAGVGFDARGTYSTTGSASKYVVGKGYLSLVPRYRVVHINVYSGSRRPVGRQTWVYIGKGTAKKPENLIAVWNPVY